MSDGWAILEGVSTALAAASAAIAVIFAIRQYRQGEKTRTEGRRAELEAAKLGREQSYYMKHRSSPMLLRRQFPSRPGGGNWYSAFRTRTNRSL